MLLRSYAQQAEDVRLARCFKSRGNGFYVDVGASHPVNDSVTKYFYDLGWSGIDIEPVAEAAALLRRDRPRDVVLEVACSDVNGESTFYEMDISGWSTLSSEVASRVQRERGTTIQRRAVETRMLSSICSEFVSGLIDFLKIDAEGHESEVLRGADFERWRPAVVVVEATVPHTTNLSQTEWEPGLLAAHYTFAVFDGINRYYVADERSELAPLLAPPVTALDGWETNRYLAANERIHQLEGELSQAMQRLDEETRRRKAVELALNIRRQESLRMPSGVVSTARSVARFVKGLLGRDISR